MRVERHHYYFDRATVRSMVVDSHVGSMALSHEVTCLKTSHAVLLTTVRHLLRMYSLLIVITLFVF